MRRAIVSWTNSSGRLGSLGLLSDCTVALCSPPESSSHGFAGQYVLSTCSFDPDVSIVTAMASPRPVLSHHSPSILFLSAELIITSCPPAVQLEWGLMVDATNVSDPSRFLNL